MTNTGEAEAASTFLDASLYGADGAFVGVASWFSFRLKPGATALYEAPARVSAPPRTFHIDVEAS